MVAAPDEAGGPVAAPVAEIERLVVRHRRGGTDDVARLGGLWMVEPSHGSLSRPIRRRGDGNPPSPRVHGSGVDVPAVFVRLRAVKPAGLDPPNSALHAQRKHLIGNM